ncbi:MAG TPA: L,D-transpeptidase family protein [Nevskiaceae bacterium]|nr:L,D-transpeptidase family protein [Nevskiaceae bacterium]
MLRARRAFLPIVAAALIAGCSESARNRIDFWWSGVRGGYSIDERVQQVGPRVEARLRPSFVTAGVAYPPHELAYLAFKDTGALQVYARDTAESPWTFIASYAVHAASGHLGPKLLEGDSQVPEGIYSIALLNPNSRYHLSLRVSYPNDFDRQMALADGRTRLGGDIMIHGDHRSIGCLAMGNDAAEDLFVLAALAATQPPIVIISPTDFRAGAPTTLPGDPSWIGALYAQIRDALQVFPTPR